MTNLFILCDVLHGLTAEQLVETVNAGGALLTLVAVVWFTSKEHNRRELFNPVTAITEGIIDVFSTVGRLLITIAKFPLEARRKRLENWAEPIPSLPEELKEPPSLWAGFCWHKNSYNMCGENTHTVEVNGEPSFYMWCRDCNKSFYKKA